MTLELANRFSVRLARTEADVSAAQRLRYDIFVTEMGGTGDMVDHAAKIEADRFDAFGDHLLLFDRFSDDPETVIGVYRLMNDDQARAAGRFYSASEFDLSPLLQSGRPLLELGRSCLVRSYRGGPALFAMWQGLSAHIHLTGAEIIFGVASFPGTDSALVTDALHLLSCEYLAPPHLRPTAIGPTALTVADTDHAIDRKAVMRTMPPLIKSYLKLGGCVGEGAFVDHAFNTTDVCMVLDVALVPDRQRAIYGALP
jgi:putative hemolysin